MGTAFVLLLKAFHSLWVNNALAQFRELVLIGLVNELSSLHRARFEQVGHRTMVRESNCKRF